MLKREENEEKKKILREKLTKSLDKAEKMEENNLETLFLLCKLYLLNGEEENTITVIEKLCLSSFQNKKFEYLDCIAYDCFENKFFSAAKRCFENLLFYLEKNGQQEEDFPYIGKKFFILYFILFLFLFILFYFIFIFLFSIY
jgi:hypothetical protein